MGSERGNSGPGCLGSIVFALLVVGVIGWIVGSDTEESLDRAAGGGGSGADTRTSWSKAKVEGRCPAFMAVGVPTRIEIDVTNRSPADWPKTVVSFYDGFDMYVVNRVSMNGKSGKRRSGPAFDDNFVFGSLDRGERGRIRFEIVPTDAGNDELRWAVWGTSGDTRLVSGGNAVYTCEDLVIQP